MQENHTVNLIQAKEVRSSKVYLAALNVYLRNKPGDSHRSKA